MSGIWRLDSGFPLTLTMEGGASLPTYGPQRPNLTGTPVRNSGPDWMANYFANPEVLVQPDRYAVGNAPRALPWVRTPGMRNATLSVFKDFPITKLREGAHLQIRVEGFNALNHPQFGGPQTTLGGGSFGVVSSTVNSPRELQLGAKLYW